MVFCCIAMVGIAIVYFIGLWIRQLFLGRHRDGAYAAWPPPPRALAGNGAWPVYGHTRLFRRHVGDVALRFDPQWTECGRLSKRQLGDCFAIFIWGQWRIGIAGPTRAQQFLQHQTLHEGWPWTPPVTLLGKSCLAFLQQEDPAQAQGLRGLLQMPLSANAVLRFAPLFARAAEQCLVAIEQGLFRKARTPRKQRSNQLSDCASPLSSNDDCCFDDDEDYLEEGVCCKLKWEALRSYSLDLFDGPLFQMHLWNDQKKNNYDDDRTTSAKTSFNEHINGQFTKEEPVTAPSNNVFAKLTTPKHCQSEEPPFREIMLLWMERIKLGLDVIKLTFGPEWMYVWMFNEYGRAINARMYVEKLVGEHVERMVALVPQVTHERGHVYHEPTTQPFPLLTMHKNLMHSKEGIFGDFSVYPTAGKTSGVVAGTDGATLGNRMRCNSMPANYVATAVERSPSPVDENGLTSPYVNPFKMEQDLARPNYESSPTVRPVIVKRDGSLSTEGTLLGMKEIQLHSNQGVPLSPLSGCGNSSVPESRKMVVSLPLGADDKPSINLTTSLIAAEGSSRETPLRDGTKKKRKKKSVDAVYNEIKANRDKQMHLTEENQVVYSFFNPARRKSSDDVELSVPVIKAVKTMSETRLMKSKHVSRVAERSKMDQDSLKEASSQPSRTIHSPSSKPQTNDQYEATLSSSLNDSGNLDGQAVAPTPLERFTTPQTSFRHQRRQRSGSVKKKAALDTGNAKVCSLMEALLQQRGPEGKGISQTTLTELMINLWMMLEVGNAWTAMALNLLAWDETALGVIQEELDVLEMEFGSGLFLPESLDRMKYLDALIYESIRLLPPFLGGLKSTTETVILQDAGVQIPKGSHIFFCQPSTQEFDLFAAVGKRPESLGQTYPCVELFGFLPLQGLEVPLMVLQCKVFLIVTLRNYAPTVSKRNTFIRRVKSAVSFRKSQTAEGPVTSTLSLVVPSDVGDAETGSNYSNGAWDLEDGTAGQCSQKKMTPSEAMKRFTKIPFPEPKRVIQLKPRGL